MNLLTIFTNVSITAIFFTGNTASYNNITRTEALTPHDTSTLDKTERVPFVITYTPALRSISSITAKHFHILISAQPALRSYPCEKNCLTSKYISDGQTSYTFHSTDETRTITHYIDCNTKKTSFTWYNVTTAPNKTWVKQNDDSDSKTVSTNTADQLTTHLISPNPQQSQNTSLLMITLLTTSHLFH